MQLKGMGKFMSKDILYNKMEIIERCLNRIREVYDHNPENYFNPSIFEEIERNPEIKE